MGAARLGIAGAGAVLGLGGFALPSYRFMVLLSGVPLGMFTEVTLPTLELTTEPITEGGLNTHIHHLPVRVDVGKVTLKRGVTSLMEFLTWYEYVLEGDIVMAKQQVTVVFLNVAGMPTIVWNFRDAYPTRWTGPTLQSGSQEIAVEELELVHHGLEFANI
jgi:phage tail-like protein